MEEAVDLVEYQHIMQKWEEASDHESFLSSLTENELYYLQGRLLKRKRYVQDNRRGDWRTEGF
jgi:hypothetical protein